MKIDSYNQTLLNFAMKIHGFCMDHCLDDDRDYEDSKYAAHHLVRQLLVIECNRAAREAVDTAPVSRVEKDRVHSRINEGRI
jgi:hypothetical protein